MNNAFFKQERKFSGSTSSVESNYVGISGNCARHTDGQVWGSPFTQKRVAFDVSIVDPNAVSHSGTGAWQSFLNDRLNPNAGIRLAEKAKTDKCKLLCQQHGMDFVVPIIFTASGGMGKLFQRQNWNPHCKILSPRTHGRGLRLR